MFVDCTSQFFDGVVPAYKYYVQLSKKSDNKKFMLSNAAIQAANMLFHFREAVEPLLPPKTFTRKAVATLSMDYDLIGDVFNATKHQTLIRNDKLIKDKFSIEETLVQSYFPYKVDGEYTKEHYGVLQPRIMVDLLNGQSVDLLEVATKVINFWASFLVSKNLTEKHISFGYEGDDFLTFEQSQEIGNSVPLYAKEMGGGTCIIVARMYRPLLNKFERLSFNSDGTMNTTPAKDGDTKGLKLFGTFPDMKPLPFDSI